MGFNFFERDKSSSYRRKITKENFIKGEKPFVFEVGKPASRNMPELGEICSIQRCFQEEGAGKVWYHKVFIEKPDGEQVLWKDVYKHEIVEYDVVN